MPENCVSQTTAAQLEPFVVEYYRTLASEGKINANLIEPRIGTKPGNTRLLLGIPLLAVPPIGIHLIIRNFVVKSQYQRLRDSVMRAATAGTLRSMTPIMINGAFLQGEVDFAPGLFMGIADDGPPLTQELEDQLEILICFSGDDDKEFSNMTKDEEYVLFRRRFAPPQSAQGRQVATFDMFLYRQRQPSASSRHFEYYAMVQPGPSGNAAFMVPEAVIAYAQERAAGRTPPLPEDPLVTMALQLQ